MVTAADLKDLRAYQGRAWDLILICFPLCAVTFAVIAATNVSLASSLAGAADQSLVDVWALWIAGVNVHEEYDGMTVAAVNRLSKPSFRASSFCAEPDNGAPEFLSISSRTTR